MAGRKDGPPDMMFFSTATSTAGGGSSGAPPDSVLRVIATDGAVMGALVPELRRRGIDPTRRERPDRIILVSEWDTSYGRELPKALETAICQSGAPCVGAPPRPPWVHRFSYLRGLDGQIPGAPRSSSRRDSEKVQPESSGPFEPLERAEGTSQVDYLRRLASHGSTSR